MATPIDAAAAVGAEAEAEAEDAGGPTAGGVKGEINKRLQSG